MQLVVMTYNVLYFTFSIDYHRGTCNLRSRGYHGSRCEQDAEIRKWQPDVLGTQELGHQACADMLCEKVGPSYRTAAGGEALLYNSSTLELIPNSTGYTKLRYCDAWACRAFGWAKYRTKEENFTFWHLNIHMTHEHGNPRGYQGRIALDMYEKYRELSPCGEPVVMTGDWNPHKDMVYGSAWSGGMNAAERVLLERNFTMLNKPVNHDSDICFFCDRIFYSSGDFDVVDHVTGMRAGSDHTPHIATLKARRPLGDYVTCDVAQPTAAPTAAPTPGAPVWEGLPACCSNCGQFCSPVSQRCYESKRKQYYSDCSKHSQKEDETAASTPTTTQGPVSTSPLAPPEGTESTSEPTLTPAPTLAPTDLPTPAAAAVVVVTDQPTEAPSPTPTAAREPRSQPTCCIACGQEGFCSPLSQSCYSYQRKAYYLSCSGDSKIDLIAQPTVAPTTEAGAPDYSDETSCCKACGQTGFCSPVSQNCYSSKRKNYYLTCSTDSNGGFLAPAPPPNCCSACMGAKFCSPVSSRCYDTKIKMYYLRCASP
eukprot:TRINITY_DN2315_c0_g1_i1.p1 TRINITY_DN2315_c0_g1~~TRINITY_DN2315_c0_g1_i1.p1  ORF type:complete len:538 (-),score=86.88 TRINITY_DN2315_c0_g1_i1:366-1979(-)